MRVERECETFAVGQFGRTAQHRSARPPSLECETRKPGAATGCVVLVYYFGGLRLCESPRFPADFAKS